MSDHPPKPPAPKKSGEHEAVKAFREKLESIRENQLPELEALNERLLKLTTPVPKGDGHPDPRREEDGEIPVDIVEPPASSP